VSGLSEATPAKQRIAQLLAPYLGAPAPAEMVEHISIYIDIFIKWNRRINLTAIRQPEEIVRRHFGESLFAARMLLAAEEGAKQVEGSSLSGRMNAASVIDIGSGAGFPGMVLKLYAPALRLTLLEPQGKKATFLRELARALGLADVNVVQERAERFSGRAELVTLRAVEKFAKVLPVAASLALPGGRLGALIGAGQLSQAASLVPGEWRSMPVPESASRVLAIWTVQ
jgi:16S rRNA (guanine527-N7)-methyltransferase